MKTFINNCVVVFIRFAYIDIIIDSSTPIALTVVFIAAQLSLLALLPSIVTSISLLACLSMIISADASAFASSSLNATMALSSPPTILKFF